MATSTARWPTGLQEPDIAVLRAVVDAAPSRVSLVTLDHRYLYANPEFLRFVGMPLEELLGKNARDVLGPEVYVAFEDTASRITPTTSPVWDGWITFSGGRKRYLEVTMAPYAPRGEVIEAIFVFARDLSDLKLREHELSESLARLQGAQSLHQQMISSALDCVILTDDQGIVIEFNPAAEATFGITREQAIGRSIVNLVAIPSVRRADKSDLEIFRWIVHPSIMGQRIRREAVNGAGEIIPVEFAITTVTVDGRQLYMGHLRDLREDVRREEEIAASEVKRREIEQVNTEIIRSALDAFVLANDKGVVLDFNPAAEAMLGFSREHAVGRSMTELFIPHEHRANHESGMKRYLDTGRKKVIGRRLQLEALSAHGDRIPVETTINEVILSDRRLFTAHMRDLREARRNQAEIESQRTRIHHIEKLSAMGSLLAGVAHELNNPLAILVAQATLLKEKAATDDVRQRATRIHAAADRAGRIVKSFLAMARQKPPAREMVNINRLVDETLEMVGYGLRSAGIEVVRDLDSSVQDIRIDADMFRQVIANIVLNAQQALLSHTHPRRLIIRTHGQVDRQVLEIEDNGPGVAPDQAARIFEPFFTTKPAGVGTGIGLAICKDVVQAHGGKLELARFEGGALFRVTLPHSPDGDTMPGAAPAALDGGERILVIDDERDVAESLAEILESFGHQTVITDSAREGLVLATRERFDRLFVDLRMPEMGGHEVLQHLAEVAPHLATRAIVMTGDTVRGPLELPVETPVLEKPFSIDEVRAIMAGGEDGLLTHNHRSGDG